MAHIYIYSRETYIDSTDVALHDRLKIGWTANDPLKRIAQQDGTSDDSPLILLDTWQVDDRLGRHDEAIHTLLKQKGYEEARVDKTREWYIIPSIGDLPLERFAVVREASQEAAGDPMSGRIELMLTPSQYSVLETTLERLRAGDTTLLQELCPRFGKTTLYLCLLHSLPEQVMVVTSYWLSVLPSYRNDISKFQQFAGMRYVDASDDNYAAAMDAHLRNGFKVVVGVSLCGAKSRREAKKEDLLPIVRISNRLVVVDEADYGAWRPNQLELVEYLQSEVV